MSKIVKIASSISEKLNFFKIPIQLKINKKNSSSPKIGVLISFAIYGYLLFALITSDAFSKKNPNVVEKEITASSTPWFNFTKENFFFGAYLSDMNGAPLVYDPTYARIYALYYDYSTNSSTGALQIDNVNAASLAPCKDDPYVQEYRKDVLKQYPQLLCLPKSEFTIGGDFSEPKTSLLLIVIMMCSNASAAMENSCKPQEDINQYILSSKLAYMTQESIFDSENYEQPFSNKMMPRYFNLDYRVKKIQRFYISKQILNDDIGLVTPEVHTKDNWGFSEITSDFDFYTANQIAEIDFIATNKVQVRGRTYVRIQEVLGQLGGIFNVFLSVGFIILSILPFSDTELLLSNHLFSFQDVKEKKSNIVYF